MELSIKIYNREESNKISKMLNSILRFNVINRDKKWSLKTLSREIFPTEVPPPTPPQKKKKLEKVYDKPRVFLDSFIGYRLVSVTKFIYDLIKKLCLRTFTNID